MKTQAFTIGLVLMLMLSLTISAEHVTKEDAAVIGKNYYWEQCQPSSGLNYDQIQLNLFWEQALDEIPLYYVFNINKNQGFIIISADDNTMPVLGYASQGNFSGEGMPDALSYFLSSYAQQIAEVITSQIEGNTEIDAMWVKYEKRVEPAPDAKSVTPLLSTTWNQDQYYNQQCPWDIIGPGGHAYAGCAAVAMAQVMKFWQHPTQGTGSNSYYHTTYGTLSANFGTTTYNYSMMPNSIFSTNTQVAQLLYHCGVAVKMNYGPYSSAPYGPNWKGDMVNALKNNFSYDASMAWDSRSNYVGNLTLWNNKVKSELDLGQPLIYVGYDASGNSGHAFNIDGYNASNYYHVNWGWSGYYDGYFSLSSLNPLVGYNFSYSQMAIFGVKPAQNNPQTYYDWGDAPDNPGFPTLSASNGARHKTNTTPSVYLGSSVDTEPDGQPHINCTGDDTDILYPPTNDDEDGVTFPASIYQNQPCTFIVVASTSGYLNAWIDYNQDYDWYDAGEQIFTDYVLNPGSNSISIQIPATANIGWNYARFRFSTYTNVGVTGLAMDGEVEDYFFRIEEDPGQGSVNNRNMIFSLDIGSDTELSDPLIDNDEVFDPGDAYLSPGVFMSVPGNNGLIDDQTAFGIDPFPMGGVPGTGAPCLNGMPILALKNDFFDMDGIDIIMSDLRNYSFGEGMPATEQFDDSFIHFPDSLYISFDDDDMFPYTDPTGSVPSIGFSSTGMVYGQLATKDEILEVDINMLNPPAAQIVSVNPKFCESDIHPNLAPNPDMNAQIPNEHDDDVDALDIPDEMNDLARTYFSADHEAVYNDFMGNPLNPGSIYLAENGMAHEVINAQNDIGLWPDTDLDAFEFTWAIDPQYNYMSLALMFSVDEDDPTTPGDESGGMMPNVLYLSFLTGYWIDLHQDGFADDIDALTIIKSEGNAQPAKADFTPLNSTIYAGNTIQFTDLSTNLPTTWIWTFNGGNPATYTGKTPPPVSWGNPGTYSVSLLVSNANGSDTKTGTVQVVPSNWQYTNTYLSHIISIPTSVNPSINGTPLNNGDLIGVFFTDQNGNEVCGGYSVWDGINAISVMANGDDGTTAIKDGFTNGESLVWKVYSWNTLSAQNLSASYDQSMPNYDGNYYNNGISALLSLNSFLTQSISLYQGWNGLSGFLNPVNTHPDTMFNSIQNELVMLKNMTGVYWPAAGINTINSWNPYSGYVIKVSQDVTFNITGSALSNRTISLTPGWNLVPVLSSTTTATSSLFNIPEIMLVKEVGGGKVYWPAMNIFTLNALVPGNSYYVCVLSAVNISFSAKATPMGINEYGDSSPGTSPWPMVDPTPGSHLVAIPADVTKLFGLGDVLGAFNKNGLCTGFVTLNGKDQILVIYGDDVSTPELDGMLEGEEIVYKLMRTGVGEEMILNPEFNHDMVDDGSYFLTNGVSGMDMNTGLNQSLVLDDIQIYPNPAAEFVKITFGGDFVQQGYIHLLDMLGNEVVSQPIDGQTETVDVSQLAEGCYLLQITGNSQMISRKVVIRK